MQTIHAIFKNGVFRPTERVDLPENTAVVFEPHVVDRSDDPQHLDRVYEILSRRYSTGEHDLAARHNEHQP